MFARRKMIRGKPKWYLVESYRDEKTGKARQRTVLYLGEHNSIAARKRSLLAQIRKLTVKKHYEARSLQNCESWLSERKIEPRQPHRGESRGNNVWWWQQAQSVERLERQIQRLRNQLTRLTLKAAVL